MTKTPSSSQKLLQFISGNVSFCKELPSVQRKSSVCCYNFTCVVNDFTTIHCVHIVQIVIIVYSSSTNIQVTRTEHRKPITISQITKLLLEIEKKSEQKKSIEKQKEEESECKMHSFMMIIWSSVVCQFIAVVFSIHLFLISHFKRLVSCSLAVLHFIRVFSYSAKANRQARQADRHSSHFPLLDVCT